MLSYKDWQPGKQYMIQVGGDKAEYIAVSIMTTRYKYKNQ